MKKIYLIILIFFAFLGGDLFAQTLSCNPQFGINVQNGNTGVFTPITVGDATNTLHTWYFGDGATSSNTTPSHLYQTNGTFTVKHILKRYQNGAVVCNDSATATITIQNACTLQASFNVSHDTLGTGPNVYYFSNTSIGFNATDSIRWSFGDGTFSNAINPTHTYTAAAGTYTVCLRIIKRNTAGTPQTNCISDVCKTIQYNSPTSCALQAAFNSYHDTLGLANGMYYFNNISVGYSTTDSIRWSFGDGTFSNQPNPTHTYSTAGTYNVCLRIIKRTPNGTLTNCISDVCHTITFVATNACTLVANFSSTSVSTGASPNVYQFTNTSTGFSATDSIRWNFGDGTFSNQINPIHTYLNAGTYNVCLRIIKRNPNGILTNCVGEKCQNLTVVINTPCTIQASFNSYHDTLGLANNVYYFSNTSIGYSTTDSIRWSFGDGTFSNQSNPTHTYATAGTYTVCLRIIKRNSLGGLTNCSSDVCRTISFTSAPPCTLVANFTSVSNSSTPNIYQFTNTSTGLLPTDSIRWSFGDGTFSNQVSPSHTYSTAGTYNVCLRILKRTTAGTANNCVSEKCQTIVVSPSTNACNLQVYFTVTYDSIGVAANVYHFTNASVNASPTDSIRWSFGDGTFSNAQNPNHIYTTVGPKTVCLVIIKRGANGQLITSCAREYCKTINVGSTTCSVAQVSFNTTQGTANPNLYYFNAVSNVSIIHQVWKITRVTAAGTTGNTITINQNNPNYLFSDTGTYRVCLFATVAPNCVKEFCRYITISSPNPGNCVALAYPNPTQTNISANVVLGIAQPITMRIYNSLNVLVKTTTTSGVIGFNTITSYVGNLPAGIYFMKVTHGNDICTGQFIKL